MIGFLETVPRNAGRGTSLPLGKAPFSRYGSPASNFLCANAHIGAVVTHSSLPYSENYAEQETHSSEHEEYVKKADEHMAAGLESIHAEDGDLTRLVSTPELFARALKQVRPPLCGADFKFLATLLRCCGDARALPQGQLIHIHMIKCEVGQTILLQNSLLKMYGKCDAIIDAYAVFVNMQQRDQHTWNFMLTVHAHNPEWDLSLDLLNQLNIEGIVVNKYVLSSIITCCAGKKDLLKGKHVHACLVGTEYETMECVGSALISLYARCDYLTDALTVFSKMVDRNVVSWSSIITSYTQHNHGREAIQLWCRMQQEAVMPKRATILGVVDACATEAALDRGKQVHCCLLGSLLEEESKILNSLINMYGKCGDMENALRLFEQLQEPSVVSWTAIMAGYAQHGHSKEAFEIFDKMQRHGIVPNKITYVCILGVVNGQDYLEKAIQMHSSIKHRGLDTDLVVGTALVNMYGKCGSPCVAQEIFNKMPDHNVISWNAMLSAYAKNDQGKEAFGLFNLMLQKGESLNNVTFINMLSACANEAALMEGKWMHDQVVRRDYCKDLIVNNALLHMYNKCGQLNSARNVFERIPNRTVVTWSSMIPAYAYHRHGEEILPMLQRMKREGVHPNPVTFKGILSACSHSGLVDDAYSCLKAMSEIFGLKPSKEHYGCVIDLFGRAGRLEEVEEIISGMPMQPSLLSWIILLSACSKEADLQRGEWVANQVFELYPDCYTPYVILSNMYVSAGRDSDAEMLLLRMKDKGLMQQEEFSCIELDGMVKEFSCVNQSYSQAEEVRNELQRLERLTEVANAFGALSHEGHLVLQSEGRKSIQQSDTSKSSICFHTERLAIAFGFISKEYEGPLFVVKSAQMCYECHRFLELVSRICKREIIISDSTSLHHMQDGACSCAKQTVCLPH